MGLAASLWAKFFKDFCPEDAVSDETTLEPNHCTQGEGGELPTV